MSAPVWEALRGVRTAKNAKLFAVVDLAHGPTGEALVSPFADQGRAECLWQGETLSDFADVAPWLVECDDSQQTYNLIETLWPTNWAVYLISHGDLDATRRALRRLTVAFGPDGQDLLMRFYDPRTLPALLSAMKPSDLKDWFDPVVAWICRARHHGSILRFDRQNGALAVSETPISPPR